MAAVFISYSSADREAADRIKDALEKRGVSSFQHDTDLTPGGNWAKELSNALDSAQVMIVLCSPEAARSQWVRRDIEFALTAPKLAERVIPVIVKPTNKLPWILDTLQGVELSGS